MARRWSRHESVSREQAARVVLDEEADEADLVLGLSDPATTRCGSVRS